MFFCTYLFTCCKCTLQLLTTATTLFSWKHILCRQEMGCENDTIHQNIFLHFYLWIPHRNKAKVRLLASPSSSFYNNFIGGSTVSLSCSWPLTYSNTANLLSCVTSLCVSLSRLDCGCIYGIQPDPAVHLISLGCSEEQQAFRGAAADSSARDEPHACSTGWIHFDFGKRNKASDESRCVISLNLLLIVIGCRLLMLFLVTKCLLTTIVRTLHSCVRKLDSCRGHWSTTPTCMTLSVLWCTHTC